MGEVEACGERLGDGLVLGELGAVIGGHGFGRCREGASGQGKKLGGSSADVAGGDEREAEVRVEIGEGNEVAAHPVMETLDGIEGGALAGIADMKALGLIVVSGCLAGASGRWRSPQGDAINRPIVRSLGQASPCAVL